MSQSTEVDTLYYITNQLYIYSYSIIIVAGLFGNTLNIIMFSTKFKESVCSFYLITSDVFNTLGLLIYNLTTIIQLTYGKNGSESSLLWCRVMCYGGDVCILYSPLALCLASVDRYFCSSRKASLRQWSSAKVAKVSLVGILLVSCSLTIPDLIYWYIDSDSNRCVAGKIYYEYMSYFLYPVVVSFIPSIILTVSGYKTYRNLQVTIHPTNSTTARHIRGQRKDNQLARMLLVQILCFFFQSVIFLLTYLYITITLYWQKSDMQIALENLIEAFAFIIYSTSQCVSFYIYYSQSATFRAGVKKMLMRGRMLNVDGTLAINSAATNQTIARNEEAMKNTTAED